MRRLCAPNALLGAFFCLFKIRQKGNITSLSGFKIGRARLYRHLPTPATTSAFSTSKMKTHA
jgi:hypothetical protein